MGNLWKAFEYIVCKERSEKEHLIDKKKGDGKLPVHEAGILSYLTISWFTPLIVKLFKHRNEQIKEEDVWTCPDQDACALNTERLETLWKEELEHHGTKEASFLRVWLKFIRTELLILIAVMCFNAVVTFLVTGYITDMTVSYLETEESSTPYAIVLVLINLIGQIARVISFTFLFFYGAMMGTKFRAGVIGISYEKLLKMKNIKGKSTSEIITLFSSDSFRVYANCVMFVYIMAVPVYFLIGTIYIYTLMGIWCLASVGVFIIFYLVQVWITNALCTLRLQTLVWTERRIRKMTEVLYSMKMIKMYAWEDSFTHSIEDIRRNEIKILLKSTILNFISNAIIPVTPSLAAVTTIALYAAAGGELQASTAFSVVATLNFMRVVVSIVPYAARLLGETLISFKRIKNLLLKEEYQAPSRYVENKANAIEIREAAFEWDEDIDDDDDKPKPKQHQEDQKRSTENSKQHSTAGTLRSTNFIVKKERLVGICGRVGCGKSSLLQAVLGRITMLCGHLAVNGTTAYAAQQAWIFNGTLKENILFGSYYDTHRYDEVIRACGLVSDINVLPNGDATEIGDRGINLSGGQKQRVSLARAVYSKSDIYLLDDPLSAVDVHVGKHIFNECIKKVLKNKTVVLVTHQLQYLEHCDDVIVMVEGEIVEQGTHNSLLTNGRHYTKLMEHYNSNNHQMDVTEEHVQSDEDRHADETEPPAKHAMNGTIPTASENITDTCQKGILTERETSETDSVSLSTYKSYIDAAGGMCVAAMVLMVYGVSSGSVVFSEWWLGIWIEQTTNSDDVSILANTSDANISNTAFLNQTTFINSTMTTNELDLHQTAFSTMNVYLLVYIGSMAGILALAVFKAIISSLAVMRASGYMHNRALQRVMKAPMKYFDANPPGRIINRFSRDLEEGDVFLPDYIDTLVRMMFNGILSLGTTTVNLPWFLIGLIPLMFVFYVIKYVSSVSMRQLKRLENVTRSPLVSHITTSCHGLGTIVAYNQEQNFINSCRHYADVTVVGRFLFDSSLRWTGLRLDLMAGLLTVVASIVVVFTKDTISPAIAALSFTMCINVASLVEYLIQCMNEVEAMFTSVERLHEYEKLEIESDVSSITPNESWPSKGRITFSEVSMKYRDDMDLVLRNISFEIAPRQKVGIVGRTGAGKSSLAVALLRLTDVVEGHIYIDGVDVGLISRKLLRTKISTIPQDPVLFAGSLRYNLDPFEVYTDQEIWDALEQVHMKNKIQLFDMTLNVFIEENGENFSVGERQLLCLARAILRQSKILVLDEATASIDTSTDAMIQETIRESFSDCTVLTIAHRLNTVLHCDLILVMEAGRVVESGNPQDLFSDQYSYFRNMLRAQV